MKKPHTLDAKRKLLVPGNAEQTLLYCVEQWIELANSALSKHGAFYVALSGGSTPKVIFEKLTHPPYVNRLDWSKVHLFWSDERAVPPTHPDSNYHMAMQAGFANVPIPKAQIHRMVAEADIEENAARYEEEMLEATGDRPLDLIMLGMGDDGHTASLFPGTEGVNIHDRKVIANFIPEKASWRLSFTFSWINQASQSIIYVIGGGKKEALSRVLEKPYRTELYPVLLVGTEKHPALWVADEAAAEELGKVH